MVYSFINLYLLQSRSNEFCITRIGSIHVKLSRVGISEKELLRVDVLIEKATIFIVFSKEESGRWPLRVDNEMNVNVVFWQQVRG